MLHAPIAERLDDGLEGATQRSDRYFRRVRAHRASLVLRLSSSHPLTGDIGMIRSEMGSHGIARNDLFDGTAAYGATLARDGARVSYTLRQEYEGSARLRWSRKTTMKPVAFRRGMSTLPVTWRINGRRLTSSKIPTLFDTGVTAVRLVLPSGTIPSSEVSNGVLATGLPVSARIANVLNFQFTSGPSAGTNQVLVRFTPKPSVNTGRAPFARYDVLYDPIRGRMGFASPSP